MLHSRLPLRALAILSLVSLALVPSVESQVYRPAPRVEFTPFGGYQWGGTLDTDAFGTVRSGELTEEDAFSWGVILSFMAQRNSAVELFYLRQDTDVKFNPDLEETRTVGKLANNYVQLGVRQDFPAGGNVRPFVSVSMGINVLDPEAGDIGTSTRFSWSLGGGAKWTIPNQRVGFRLDARWMVTPVPSGTYGSWCDVWGCYAVEGTDWLNQGQVSGGLVFSF